MNAASTTRPPVDCRSMRRRAAAGAAGLLLGLLWLLVTPAPASAHAVLSSSDPAANTVMLGAPSQLTLTFTESVQPVAGKIMVLAPDGTRVDKGQPTSSGTTVTVPVDAEMQGTYLVSFRVVSADSHPIGGGFSYSVGKTSTPPSAAEIASGVDPVLQVAMPVVKFLGYAGVLLLVGPVLVLTLLWPQRLSRRRPAAVAWTGLSLIIVSTLASLWLQGAYLLGTPITGVGLSGLGDVLGTTFGTVLLVRLGVLLAATLLLRPVLTDTGSGRADVALLGVLGVAAVATWPLTGHPSASPVPVVSVVVDAVHLAAMAVWLGGLVMLALFLLPQADERELGAILPIWSRWAAAAVGALVLAGTTQALIEVGSFAALVNTSYGRMIMAKVALVAGVLAVAAIARRLVHRGDPTATRKPLRRGVLVELGVTAVVLGITAVLVQTPPGRSAAATTTPVQNTTVTTTLKNDTFALQVNVTPAKVGNNSVHLYAYTLDNKPLPVVEWQATAALPAKGVEGVEIPLLRITDNHTIGEITLPAAGQWQLTFTLRLTEIDQSSVTGTVTIG